jgi:thermostable 8-oxoguanine DNA glycosylase
LGFFKVIKLQTAIHLYSKKLAEVTQKRRNHFKRLFFMHFDLDEKEKKIFFSRQAFCIFTANLKK